MLRAKEEERAKQAAEAAKAKAAKDAVEFEAHSKAQEEWASKADEIKRQEAEALQAESTPLRSYLVKHVMPTLTKGLAEVCRCRPDDPVDALAEYLFKNNPRIE
jgi:adenylate kinase